MPVEKWRTPSWHNIATGTGNAWSGITNANPSLFMWGLIQFEVIPLNIHEYEHDTETDWAHKEIAGAAIYREWVGENDERLAIRGKLFPYRIGGISEIEDLEAQRRGGIPNLMMRGDGAYMGWYVCERLVRAHTYLSSEGIGQQIVFDAIFARVPVPAADEEWARQNRAARLAGG